MFTCLKGSHCNQDITKVSSQPSLCTESQQQDGIQILTGVAPRTSTKIQFVTHSTLLKILFISRELTISPGPCSFLKVHSIL